MSSIYDTGSRGERLIAEYLKARGRRVERSDTKTFDLIVDGRYAEVKSSDDPYTKLQFIGLTDAQYAALAALIEGVPFSIFLVCNAKVSDHLDVIEFDAAELLKERPKIECTYYWYRTHLDKCRESAGYFASPEKPSNDSSQRSG
jgi:hypothetical protein